MNDSFSVAIVVCGFDPSIDDPEALLDSYHAPRAWADAVVEAGADHVSMVHQFHRNAFVRRGNVDYHFVADRDPSTSPRSFPGIQMVNATLRREPRVVHFDGFVFPLVVRHLRLRLPRRSALVVQDHGGLASPSVSFRSWRRRALFRFGLRAADGFLFTARDQASPYLRARIIRSADQIHEIPESSTSLGSWPNEDGPNPGLPGRPALLWVGRLDGNKDPLTVLDGFDLIAAALPEAALTMVYGDDILLPEVMARIERSPRLRPRVHLRGRVRQQALPALYRNADLFVLGSHREVACFSLIEALSCGTTPVVTDIAPFRALTNQGRIGALFQPGDARGFARAVEQVTEGDLTFRRATVRAHFDRVLSWRAVGSRALAIYRGVAEARNRVRSL